MARRQGEGERLPASGGPPGGGVDPLSLATLLGVVAVLVVAFASWRDIDRIDRSLGERLDRLETRLDPTGGRAPARAPQRGPDPNRVYAVRTDGSPVRGKAAAPVTIAEFSDYQ